MAVQTQFSTDPNAIVTVHVSIVEAPTPINYQRTGAFVTFGGTTLAPQDTSLLTQLADLDVLIQPPMVVSTAVWAGGSVTVTLATPLVGVTVGDVIPLVLSGFTPAAYNGRVQATITGRRSKS
jgi:hypothetical protein